MRMRELLETLKSPYEVSTKNWGQGLLRAKRLSNVRGAMVRNKNISTAGRKRGDPVSKTDLADYKHAKADAILQRAHGPNSPHLRQTAKIGSHGLKHFFQKTLQKSHKVDEMLKSPDEMWGNHAKADARAKRLNNVRNAGRRNLGIIKAANKRGDEERPASAIYKHFVARRILDRADSTQPMKDRKRVKQFKANKKAIGEMLLSAKELMLQGKDMRGSKRSQRLDNVKQAGVRNRNIAKSMAKTATDNDLAVYKANKADNILGRANDRTHFQNRKSYKSNWVASTEFHKTMKKKLT